MDRKMPKVEVFFDCSSPWTYLGFVRLGQLEDQLSFDFDWKPILVGGVFNAVNESVYQARANPHPIKQAYYMKDLADWSRFVGVKIGNPPVFPVRSVDAMRACCFAKSKGALKPFALALFESYWGDLNDISQTEEILACAKRAGLSETDVKDALSDDIYKAELKSNTQNLIDRGGFGSPTVFINGDDMYFGNDRMELIAAKLVRSDA